MQNQCSLSIPRVRSKPKTGVQRSRTGRQGKKPPPGRRGAGRRLGGRLQPPLSVRPAPLGQSTARPGDARALCGARRSVLVADPACCSVHPRLLWHGGGPGQGVVVPLCWWALGPASHRGLLVPKPNPLNQIRGAGLGLGVMSAFLVAFCSL